MEPKKSLVLPLALTVLISALGFGGLGYYVGNSSQPAPIVTLAPLPATTTTVLATLPPSPTATPGAVSTAVNTADWKTYSTKKFNFSLKYPADWKVEDSLQDFDKVAALNQTLKLSKGDVSITLWVNPAGWGMEQVETVYDIEYKNNQLVIGGKKVYPPNDSIQIEKGTIEFTGTMNGDKYIFLSRSVMDASTENLIKAIISSYKTI